MLQYRYEQGKEYLFCSCCLFNFRTMFFTRYTVRFASHEEIVVVEVDDCESLAIEKAQNIMKRNKRILNQEILDTAKVVYVEAANTLCY